MYSPTTRNEEEYLQSWHRSTKCTVPQHRTRLTEILPDGRENRLLRRLGCLDSMSRRSVQHTHAFLCLLGGRCRHLQSMRCMPLDGNPDGSTFSLQNSRGFSGCRIVMNSVHASCLARLFAREVIHLYYSGTNPLIDLYSLTLEGE
jgi:hypothetical protein